MIGRRFPANRRADAAAKLASQRSDLRAADLRRSLRADAAEATAAGADNVSISSALSSVPGADDAATAAAAAGHAQAMQDR